MKKLIETLKNIWSIEELRKRILFTLLLVLVYRVGCYITLPGINPNMLTLQGSQEGLLGILNMFAYMNTEIRPANATPVNSKEYAIVFPIIHLDHPAMMTRYGCGVVRAQA